MKVYKISSGFENLFWTIGWTAIHSHFVRTNYGMPYPLNLLLAKHIHIHAFNGCMLKPNNSCLQAFRSSSQRDLAKIYEKVLWNMSNHSKVLLLIFFDFFLKTTDNLAWPVLRIHEKIMPKNVAVFDWIVKMKLRGKYTTDWQKMSWNYAYADIN